MLQFKIRKCVRTYGCNNDILKGIFMAKPSARVDLILKNAEIINEMKEAIDRTAKNQERDPQAWQNATRLFNEAYDRLAFPGGLEHGMRLLSKQDPTAVTIAIEYLEANPYCFRSGYIKAKIAHYLKKALLTQAQKKQIQDILITAIKDDHKKEEYKKYCRLARVVRDDVFCSRICAIIEQSSDQKMAEAAQYMLDIVMQK